MVRRYALIVAAMAIAVLMAFNPARAQVERSGGEAQKFMQQYQQLASERAALEEQVAQLKKDLDAAKADAAAMKKQRDAQRAHSDQSASALAEANASKQATEQSLEQYKQRMSELVTRFRETALNLQGVESDRSKVRQELAERNSAFDICAEKNLQLYEISSEVLGRYEHVGLFTKVSASEPFTQITRTRIENLVDDYRARALELRVKKQPSKQAH